LPTTYGPNGFIEEIPAILNDSVHSAGDIFVSEAQSNTAVGVHCTPLHDVNIRNSVDRIAKSVWADPWREIVAQVFYRTPRNRNERLGGATKLLGELGLLRKRRPGKELVGGTYGG
jgi:hypothetical protein